MSRWSRLGRSVTPHNHDRDEEGPWPPSSSRCSSCHGSSAQPEVSSAVSSVASSARPSPPDWPAWQPVASLPSTTHLPPWPGGLSLSASSRLSWHSLCPYGKNESRQPRSLPSFQRVAAKGQATAGAQGRSALCREGTTPGCGINTAPGSSMNGDPAGCHSSLPHS